jgi:hypothetical protein
MGHSNAIWMGEGSKNYIVLIKYFYLSKDGVTTRLIKA